jgi:hypothetical protein
LVAEPAKFSKKKQANDAKPTQQTSSKVPIVVQKSNKAEIPQRKNTADVKIETA